MRKVKRFRIITAGIFFSLLFLVFFNPYGFFSFFGVLVEGTQFTPTLLNTVFNRSVRSIIALFLLVVITVLFGRVYCSFLCPLGIFQDAAMFIKGTKKFKRISKKNILRYGTLFATIITAVLGSLFLVHFLDPYAIFGRAVTHIFGRGFVTLQNSVSSVLSSFQFYGIEIITHPVLQTGILVIALLQLSGVLFAAAFKGRLYCNYICPVGTLLGLISRVSFFKLNIHNNCTHCGACETICKAGCISYKDKYIDNELCVRCYNCIDACPVSAISHQKTGPEAQDPSKKAFLHRGIGLLSGIAAAGAFPLRLLLRKRFSKNNADFIVPPGSMSIEHFESSCISCHLCVSVCPTKIITPSLFLHGKGIMQPVLTYQSGFCQYNCNKCSQVCPTDAIKSISVEEKKRTAIGKVTYIADLCILYTDRTDCGACAEHCPTGAVTTVEKNSLFYPSINSSLCIGCGACEYACPVQPKAIVVTPLSVHSKLLTQIDDESEEIRVEEGDFPF